ncbi:MAG: 30S ribosomal protein S12 methylthiotransferase RimO [Desulfobacterales bacterium]
MKIHLVNLGCARNLVDGEMMLGLLERAGWSFTDNPAEAGVIIVNTCSFIESAAQESVDTLLELATLKKEGVCRRLIATGCLPERYRQEIIQELPEVDIFLGTGAYDRIVDAVEGTIAPDNFLLPPPDKRHPDRSDAPRILTNVYSTYLKVSEGCSRHCTYCIIPKLRGRQRSRPLEDIAAEAENLIRAGARELNLVAQDTTSWGYDLNPPQHPAELLQALSGIDTNVWIRVLYGHPDKYDERLIRTIGQEPGICSYFDIPVQHVSSPVLKRMGRNYSRRDLLSLFQKIRAMVPDAVLRTTLIVGFPGETHQNVEKLLKFIEEVKFDHLGVFTYSDETDLPSHHLPNHVSKRTAMKRFDQVMRAQALISEKNNEKYIGQTFRVLVEESSEEGVFIGRTWFQAPDVDGITYIRTFDKPFSDDCRCDIGSVVSVKITDTLEYDLIGEPA